MNDIIINVIIADRNYNITIDRDKEEGIRKAVNDINKKVKNFAEIYAYKDKQDLLAMTALQVSTENLSNIVEIEGKDEILKNKLNDIAVLVDNYLDK
jgi:cell division protein ZapA (FtsZ GTPase activity inhibitor)